MPGGRQTSCLSVEDKGSQPGGACFVWGAGPQLRVGLSRVRLIARSD